MFLIPEFYCTTVQAGTKTRADLHGRHRDEKISRSQSIAIAVRFLSEFLAWRTWNYYVSALLFFGLLSVFYSVSDKQSAFTVIFYDLLFMSLLNFVMNSNSLYNFSIGILELDENAYQFQLLNIEFRTTDPNFEIGFKFLSFEI